MVSTSNMDGFSIVRTIFHTTLQALQFLFCDIDHQVAQVYGSRKPIYWYTASGTIPIIHSFFLLKSILGS